MTFRFAGKKLLLTYPQYKADKPALHAFLNKKLKQEVQVKICHELHQDGNTHTHCAVLAQAKMDIKNADFLDFEGHHPNMKPPMNIEHWKNQVKYIDKEDTEVYGEIVVSKTKDEEFDEACAFVKQCKNRKQMYMAGPHLKIISTKVTFFENYFATQREKKSAKATFTQFKKEKITDWSTSHLIWGKAGSGKTQWALSHFKNPLMVSHIEDLQDFDIDEHDGIVFDDMSFRHLPGQAIIHLLDSDFERSIHCRFRNAAIPAGTKKIFCHNDGNIFEPEKDISEDQRAGIARRYTATYVAENLF